MWIQFVWSIDHSKQSCSFVCLLQGHYKRVWCARNHAWEVFLTGLIPISCTTPDLQYKWKCHQTTTFCSRSNSSIRHSKSLKSACCFQAQLAIWFLKLACIITFLVVSGLNVKPFSSWSQNPEILALLILKKGWKFGRSAYNLLDLQTGQFLGNIGATHYGATS